jgi:hypothetical protein
MTSPLSGMPNKRDAWTQHMETTTGQKSVDLAKADQLGLDQATVDKLHKADANGDGRLDWDEAWKAFDSFDSNGDSGSVDLDKLGKSDKALAFARGLTTLVDANKTVAGLQSKGGFDSTQAHSYTVDGRTVTFPADALAKPAVVDTDYEGRPQISFQLADGTDGRLYKDATKGWIAVVDHQHYKVDLGTSGDVQIKGLLTDNAKAKQIEGHAFTLRVGSGAATTVASDRADAMALDANTPTILKNSAPGASDIQVEGATRFEKGWIGDGNKTMEYTFHFKDGRQAALRWSGNNKYTVRADGGSWASLDVPEGRYPYAKLTLAADGTVRAETRPMMAEGSKIDVFGADGKLIKTIDFSTEEARTARKQEGAAQMKAGDAEGVALVNRAYKEQIEHGLIVAPHTALGAGWKDRTLAPGYGERMGKAIAGLAASGKLDEARALQKKVVDELNGVDSPLTDADAKRLALDAYAQQLVAAGEPVASALLPDLATQVASHKDATPSRLYMSSTTYDAVDKLAQAQVAAGKLDAAKALYSAAANSDSTERRNLDGYKSGDTFVVTTGSGGTMALDDPPNGTAVKAYTGLTTSTARIAQTKVQQLEFTQKFQASAAALPGLTLTDAEKAQVPPSPEVMKKYFAAKYDGQMPQKMADLQAELGAYLKVAYAHPQLNVPDSVKGWTGADLATLKDGRLAADCFVTNRAVAHMLSGVGGLELTGVQNDGHSRLVITSTDGSQGFVQSNDQVAKLEGKSTDSLQSRVESTIAKNAGLQVLYGMPAPIRLGSAVQTGASLTDVDAAFDASFAAAEKNLAGISTTSTDGKLRAGGEKVRDLVKRYESFRTRANDFVKKWAATPAAERTDAMKKEKDALEAEMKQLDKDLASARGQVPTSQVRFIDAQKKNGGIFDLGVGRDFFTSGQVLLINGESGFSLGDGSGW